MFTHTTQCIRDVLDSPVSSFSLSLYRPPFLYTLFSSRFTLIINNNKLSLSRFIMNNKLVQELGVLDHTHTHFKGVVQSFVWTESFCFNGSSLVQESETPRSHTHNMNLLDPTHTLTPHTSNLTTTFWISHSPLTLQTSRLLTSFLSLGVPVPHSTQCIRDVLIPQFRGKKQINDLWGFCLRQVVFVVGSTCSNRFCRI